MTIRLLTILLLSFIKLSVAAQTPQVAWQKLFSGNEGDFAQKIIATTDGGSLIVGNTESGGRDFGGYLGKNFSGDILVIKLSADGTLEWQVCLGGQESDVGISSSETSDGYLIFGITTSSDCRLPEPHGGIDFYLSKLSKSGEIIWEKRYGGEKHEYGNALALDNSGNIYMVGSSESSGGDLIQNKGNRDCWVIKVSPVGNLIWQKSFGGSGEEGLSSICVTNDGSIMVAGYTQLVRGDFSGGQGKTDAVVARLSATSGNIEWIKLFGGSEFDQFSSIIRMQDNSFLVGGRTTSKDGHLTGLATHWFGIDAWLININAVGNINWKKIFAGEFDDHIQELKLVRDGTVAGAGYRSMQPNDACSFGLNGGIWIFRLTNEGNVLWEKKIASKQNTGFASLDMTSDFSIVIASTANSTDIPGYYGNSSGQNSSVGDIWTIRLQPETLPVLSPSFGIEKSTAFVCQGKEATITTKTFNTGIRPQYRWKRNGTDVPGIYSTSLTAADFKNGEIISCTISSGDHCELSPFSITDQVVISFNNNTVTPVISVSVNTEFNCGCTEFRFKAKVSNAGSKPSWQWLRNGKPVGYNKDEFVSKDLIPGDIIRCEYYDRGSCVSNPLPVSSDTVVIKDHGDIQAPEIFIRSVPQRPCLGKPVKLIATYTNAGMYPTLDWKLNNQSLGMSRDSITLFNLKATDIIVCTLKPDSIQACLLTDEIISNELMINFSDGDVEPRVQLQTLTDTVCIGGKITIRALATDVGNRPGFIWFLNNRIVGDNSDSLVLNSVNDLDQVRCRVYPDKSQICPTKDSADAAPKILYTKQNIAASIFINQLKNDVCQGEPIILSATHSNAGRNPEINWYVNNTLQIQNRNEFTYAATKHGDQIHFILKPDVGACAFNDLKSEPVTAVVRDTPFVKIYPADTTIIAGNSVQFRVELSEPIQSFVWSPSAQLLNSNNLLAKTQILQDETVFSLTVTNDRGCRSRTDARIDIAFDFYMPNAFTPNGDGLNDLFRIPGRVRAVVKSFQIFDRWGNPVFKSEGTGGWDGNFNGKNAPAGMYIYQISGTNDKGNFVKKGSVVLIR